MTTEFKLPELGENIEYGTIAKILVSAGTELKRDQPILELETDKAVIEVPSDLSGVITDILVKEGEKIKVGQTILTLSSTDGASELPKQKATPPPIEKKEVAKTATAAMEPAAHIPASTAELPIILPARVPVERREAAPAAPSVRRFAREISIDVNLVPGTGPGGRISIEDVKAFAKSINEQRAESRTVFSGIVAEALPDFGKWGEIERKPISSVRHKTAQHLSYAWATIPHVTQFDKADVTELEPLRQRYAAKAEATGGKLTVTAILLKIVASALKVFPQFNASIDMAKNEVVYKKYVHIGIAVDTDRGLLVPVVRDVDKKNIIQLSVELSQLAEKARNKKLSLEEMQGGNFSISNLGGIGGTGFSPVVNAPEVAILGISRSRMEPVYRNGQFEPRLILPLSLSYDHRLIDGADGARFLRWIVEAAEEPFVLSLEG